MPVPPAIAGRSFFCNKQIIYRCSRSTHALPPNGEWTHRERRTVWSSGMMKRVIIFLLLMTVAVTAFAAQDRVQVASVDKNIGTHIKKQVVPPVVNETYEYYDVRGNGEKELRCQMNHSGCMWEDGKRYDSVTSWHVKWDYDYDRAPNSCSAASFQATLEVTYRYPKWIRPDNVPPALVDKWDGYMKNLIAHEKGHRDLAAEATADLSRTVGSLPPATTCAALDQELRKVCRLRMKKLNDDEKEYDEATHHGATQGALFP